MRLPTVRNDLLAAASRSLSYCLGSLVIALAIAAFVSGAGFAGVVDWVVVTLGLPYSIFFLLLATLAFFAWARLLEAGEETRRFWLAFGLQAAAGISTLALTYKLVGIALGIGALAGRPLTPASIQEIIRDLTANFSLAFLTTAVSLPAAMAFRALLLLTVRLREGREGR
jgi:hypothetical protein